MLLAAIAVFTGNAPAGYSTSSAPSAVKDHQSSESADFNDMKEERRALELQVLSEIKQVWLAFVNFQISLLLITFVKCSVAAPQFIRHRIC
jgi:hypothetical protein